ncbi:MAG: DMT family transporter [Paracoccaceae bacterium]
MPLSDNLRGAMYMCVSMFAFTFNDSLMKSVTQHLPLFQAIAMRGTLAVGGLLMIARVTGAGGFWPERPGDRRRIVLRSLADVAATILFLGALMRMPLANLTAVMQATPLAVMLGAALVFGEAIGWRRAVAAGAGFVGVMLIVRPGGDGFGQWSAMALGSVACVVLRDLATRGVGRTVGAVTVALWTGGMVTAMGYAGSAVQGWIWPDMFSMVKVVAAASSLIFGYMFSVMTMRVGDVGFVAPFRYTALIWAVLLGWLAFGSLPDRWTMAGAAVVVASGLYSFWRERGPARRRPA